MKIFGFDFTTSKELREIIVKLTADNKKLTAELESCEADLADMQEAFPFDLGQVVYDVSLKNDKGKYTKTKPSREYSTITEIIVTEKNYFSLVARLDRNDVFFDYESAEEYLNFVCK